MMAIYELIVELIAVIQRLIDNLTSIDAFRKQRNKKKIWVTFL